MNQTAAILLTTLAVLVTTFFLTNWINSRQRKMANSDSLEDWEVGGRSLPLYVVVITQFAAAIGGGIIVGQVGNAYKNGFSIFLYGVLAQLAFFFLMFIAKWLRENNFATIPDVLQHFSGPSKTVKIVAGVLTIIVPFGWICGQLIAFGKLYALITGFSSTMLVWTLAFGSLFFVIPAGLITVAWADFFFGVLKITFASVVCYYTISLAGGMTHVLASVPANIVELPGSIFSVGAYTSLLWIFALVPGGLTNQIYYQRIFACKEIKEVKHSLWLTAVICFLAYFWAAAVGLSVRSMNPNLGADGELAMGWLIAQLPTWLLAVFSGLVICATLATISAGVQSVVVNLNRDVHRELYPESDSKKSIKLSKIFSVIVIVVAAALAVSFPGVIAILVASYGISAAGLFCPIFVSYAFRKTKFITKNAIVAGMFVGIVACIVSMFVKTDIPYVIWGIVPSGLSMIIVSKMEQIRTKCAA